MPFERLFETDGYGLLACDGHVGFTYGTAVAADHFQSLTETHFVGAVERDVGIGKVHIFHFTQVAHPFFRDVAVPEHCAQDTAGRCRVAIRILSAAGGDIECLREVALAVKQADKDVGAVDHGVDVERHEYAVRAADIRAPFLFAFEPGAFPVAGILLVPGDDVFHAPVIAALFGDGFQGFLDDESDVVRDERKRIHRCHVNSAVPAVAVVHDVSHAVAELRGRVGHARGHEPRKIGFDLEVEVVGMGVVDPVPRFGRADAVEDVVACGLVGVPQYVAGIGEGCGERIHRGVDAQAVENFDERQIHVYVVVESRGVFIPPFDVVFRPRDRGVFLDHRAVEFEFRRAAVGASDSLAGPAALDFVEQPFFGEGDLFRELAGRRAGIARDDGRGRAE